LFIGIPPYSSHDQASAVGGLYATLTYTVEALPPDRQNRWFAGDTPLCDATSIAETHSRVNTFIPISAILNMATWYNGGDRAAR